MIFAGDLLGLSKTSDHRAIHTVMNKNVDLHKDYIFYLKILGQSSEKSSINAECQMLSVP